MYYRSGTVDTAFMTEFMYACRDLSSHWQLCLSVCLSLCTQTTVKIT